MSYYFDVKIFAINCCKKDDKETIKKDGRIDVRYIIDYLRTCMCRYDDRKVIYVTFEN